MAARPSARIIEARRKTDDDDANKVYDSLEQMRRALYRHPFLCSDGVLVSQALTAGNNVIRHGLGRKPSGWMVLRSIGAAATLYEVADTATDRVITLNSAGSPTSVDLWFF
jgi:hypothetical protein